MSSRWGYTKVWADQIGWKDLKHWKEWNGRGKQPLQLVNVGHGNASGCTRAFTRAARRLVALDA